MIIQPMEYMMTQIVLRILACWVMVGGLFVLWYPEQAKAQAEFTKPGTVNPWSIPNPGGGLIPIPPVKQEPAIYPGLIQHRPATGPVDISKIIGQYRVLFLIPRSYVG